MEMYIPIPYPKCGGKMYCVYYEVTLNILKKEVGKSVRVVTMKLVQRSSNSQYTVCN